MATPRALFLLGCTLALLSCGEEQPRNDSDALPPVVDDSCARFDFRFTAGGCPAAECGQPLCSCPAAVRCLPGKNDRCMTGLDCEVACAADPETVFVCSIEIEPCLVDADCADGLCVIEPGASRGECESGERAARCRDDRDCRTGNCVAGNGGNRACSPGDVSDLCNRDADCQGGPCELAPGALTGECE